MRGFFFTLNIFKFSYPLSLQKPTVTLDNTQAKRGKILIPKDLSIFLEPLSNQMLVTSKNNSVFAPI
jgi:hypothetical protein